MKRTLSIVTVALVLACCVGPTKFVDRPEGTIWGWDPAAATRLAEALPLAELVRDRLGSKRVRRVEVHLTRPGERGFGSHGTCFSSHIEITPRGMRVHEYVLAHEACHWYIAGSRFDGLPLWVEEGLCDWIAYDVLGLLEGRRMELEDDVTSAIHLEHLHYDAVGWDRLTGRETDALYALGFRVVDRLGLERLAELNENGATSMDYLFAAELRIRIHPPERGSSAREDTR